jgi:hypothetical protein
MPPGIEIAENAGWRSPQTSRAPKTRARRSPRPWSGSRTSTPEAGSGERRPRGARKLRFAMPETAVDEVKEMEDSDVWRPSVPEIGE